MNKLSGYREFTLDDGTHVEMKFSNGAYLLYGEQTGLTTFEDIERSLTPGVDDKGKVLTTPGLVTSLRRFVCAAITYAARSQGKKVPFTDEMQVQEWIDEIGFDSILSGIEKAAPASPEAVEEEEAAEGKKKSRGIKATQ